MAEITILFALEAETAMLNGDFDTAIKTCESGIEAFPDYVSAYSIYLKSLMLSGDIPKAKKILNLVLEKYALTKDIEFIKLELDKFPDEPEDFEDIYNKEILNIDVEANNSYKISNEFDINDFSNSDDVVQDLTAEADPLINSEETSGSFESEAIQSDLGSNYDTNVEEQSTIETEAFSADDMLNSFKDALSEEIVADTDNINIEAEFENQSELKNVEFSQDILDNAQTDINNEIVYEESPTETIVSSEIDDSQAISNNGLEDNQNYTIDAEHPIDDENEIGRNQPNLRLINFGSFTAKQAEIRASNLRIIPGLEFSALKIGESKLSFTNHLTNLPEPPEWGWISNTNDENYFRKAEKDDSEIDNSKAIIFTETMAKIYEQQGAFDSARKVYLKLSIDEPERKDEFLEKAEALS